MWIQELIDNDGQEAEEFTSEAFYFVCEVEATMSTHGRRWAKEPQVLFTFFLVKVVLKFKCKLVKVFFFITPLSLFRPEFLRISAPFLDHS